jgi:Tol biopolymer transport system component
VLATCILLGGWSEPAKASLPGENGRLVFASGASSGPGINNPTYDTEIFTIRPDGTGLVQLTHNKLYDYDPAWSPNGNKIAYSHGSGDATDIYVMRADGTQKMLLTDSRGTNWNPTWSANGARIAFQSNRDVTNTTPVNTNIYSVRNDGTGEKQLTKNTASDLMPDWSPDGTKIAFYTTRYSTNDNSSSDIAVMNADGSNPRRLTSTPGYDYDPAWSPNGGRIAFSNAADIYKIRADGTGLKNVTATQNPDDFSYDPAWSSDGTKIAFGGARAVAFDPDLGEYIYERGIYLINPDGSGESKIPGTENFSGTGGIDWQRLPAQ